MLDVKDLFSPKRQRLLRGELEPEDEEVSGIGLPHLPLSWRRFPDPAARSLLQSQANRAWDVLGTCGTSLKNCQKDFCRSRDVLRQCRTQLEAHLACSAAVCDLLAGRWSDPKDEDWASDTISCRPPAASRPRYCVGRVRCFFCRQRASLEQEEGELGPGNDAWDLDSAVLADVSCTASSSDGFHIDTEAGDRDDMGQEAEASPITRRRRRRTSRERGHRRLYKLKRIQAATSMPTWYATHTVEPVSEPPKLAPSLRDQGHSERSMRSMRSMHSMRSGSSGRCSPVSRESSGRKEVREHVEQRTERSVSKEVLEDDAPQRELPKEADAAELEPYTTAAARFRAEMEFLDMSSFPGSPEVPMVHKSMGQDSPERALPRPPTLLADVEVEAWQRLAPPAPPPSASHARKLLPSESATGFCSSLPARAVMGHASPQDPEGWRGTTLHVGDYVEFACSDTSHCRQGAVLARLGRLNEKTRDGKWAEVSFIAASDEHLRWWLNTRDGAEAVLAHSQVLRGDRGRDGIPVKKYVEEELQRLSVPGFQTAAEDAGDGAYAAAIRRDASTEWAGELRMRKLQSKGGGKAAQKGEPRSDGLTLEDELSSNPEIPVAWRWTLCTFRLLKRCPVDKQAVLKGWAAAAKRRQSSSAAAIGAVHQPSVARPVRQLQSSDPSPVPEDARRPGSGLRSREPETGGEQGRCRLGREELSPDPEPVFCANAGDSRCVLARGGRAQNLSRDHKPELKSERRRITQAGGFVSADGRVDGNLNLSRSLGDFAYKKDASRKATEQKISAEAEVKRRGLGPADQYLAIGCDGIFEKFSSQELLNFLLPHLRRRRRSQAPLSKACSAFLDANIAKSPQKVAEVIRPESWGPGRWTLVLRSVAKAHRPDLALQLLALIGSGRVQADVFHYSAAIASGPGGLWPSALSVLQHADDSGIIPNEYTFGSVMRSGDWVLALDCLRSMGRRRLPVNDVIHTTVLNTHAHQHQWERALSHHDALSEITTYTAAAAMSACEKCSNWVRSIAILSSMLGQPGKPGFSPDLVCSGSAVSACSQGQRWQAASDLLSQMSTKALERNEVCFNAAISSCAQRWEAALCLFECLHRERIEAGICAATTAHICRSSWESTLLLLESQLRATILPDGAMAGSVLQAIKEQTADVERCDHLLLKLLDLWKKHLPQDTGSGASTASPALPRMENVLVSQAGLVVLCKPPGVTTESAVAKLAKTGTGLCMVSRLDAQTSGVLPLAVGEVASRFFQAQFAGRLVQKEYVCLCEGATLGDVGTTGKISHPLLTTGVDGQNSRTQVAAEGREAHTVYLVKSRFAGTSEGAEVILLRVRPLTGRTHQIRVHLASIGRPIVGDVVYGRGFASSQRLFLHCARIRLRDLEGRLLTVKAPLPSDLSRSLRKLQDKSQCEPFFGMGHVALLYGKRPLQRIAVGAAKQQLEIPLGVVADIPGKVDNSVSYVGNKYNALPWKDFVDIKLDARNLIEADVKSALTDLDWFGKACPLCPPLLLSKRQFFGGFGQEVNALYAGKQTETELDVAAVAPGSLAFPAAVEGCPGLAVHRPLRGRDGIPELADEEALDPLGPCKFCPTTLRSRQDNRGDEASRADCVKYPVAKK
ncbi:putative protein phosphatase 2C 6 [Symbiodinium microadriaticum]|uniref:PPM-type phosphatase domain-containing protein n=1 Tax=Symbiodinium microadriaticum TaxID=2951 RepID=A0A1Q9CAL5_SYMMI|nr:putative protein phosphatase 2C 6 [Symbiodinium microadriaticum]